MEILVSINSLYHLDLFLYPFSALVYPIAWKLGLDHSFAHEILKEPDHRGKNPIILYVE